MGHLYHGYVSHNQRVVPMDLSWRDVNRGYSKNSSLLNLVAGLRVFSGFFEMDFLNKSIVVSIWLWINTYKNTIFSGLFTSINPS